MLALKQVLEIVLAMSFNKANLDSYLQLPSIQMLRKTCRQTWRWRKSFGLWVDDARKSYEETVKEVLRVYKLFAFNDKQGEVVMASIKTYGDTIHTFVERKNYKGAFLPNYVAKEPLMDIVPVGLKYVDHCVGNVELGEMNKWVKFYEDVMGFRLLLLFDDNDISTERH